MRKLTEQTRKLLRDPAKRRAWIIYQLSLMNSSVAGVANHSNVTRQTMYSVFQKPYPRMEKLLADAIGMAPKDLFPERYDVDGLPNRKMGRPTLAASLKVKNSSMRRRCNVNHRRAAR